MTINPDQEESGREEWRQYTGMTWAVLLAIALLTVMVLFTVVVAHLGKPGW